MDTNTLHLLLGLGVALFTLFVGVFVGKHWGVLETKLEAYAGRAEVAAQSEKALLKAAWELAEEKIQAAVRTVETRAAADLAQARADLASSTGAAVAAALDPGVPVAAPVLPAPAPQA